MINFEKMANNLHEDTSVQVIALLDSLDDDHCDVSTQMTTYNTEVLTADNIFPQVMSGNVWKVMSGQVPVTIQDTEVMSSDSVLTP